MRIDIDTLTEAELIDLNNRIVERLRFLNQMRAHAQMLTRYNRKTVTVVTDSGERWNVAPRLPKVVAQRTACLRCSQPVADRDRTTRKWRA
jgi:hypothetical protein